MHTTADLFDAWTTIEVLSPQPAPERDAVEEGRIIPSFEDRHPWFDPERGKNEKEKSLYWIVYLGSMSLSVANEIILEKFPDEQGEERRPMKGQSPLAAVVLDEMGYLVSTKTVLSSFAWGIGQLCKDKIETLASFPKASPRIIEKLHEYLIVRDEEDKRKPVADEQLEATLIWLRKEFGLPDELVANEWKTHRIGFRKNMADPPDPDLLNSFFLEELSQVADAWKSGHTGDAIKQYILGIKPEKRIDVIRNEAALRKLFDPARFPVARWPGKGRHPLFLMQQAAVNHIMKDLDDSGLVAINGPPGTGKTTLLRDLIAAIVVKRAIALAEYTDPMDAFIYEPVDHKDGSKEHRYLLKPELLGHEIVVASYNNNAVENISREIPAMKAIADDFDPALRYFSSIADQLLAAEEPEERKHAFKGSCWGMVAAVTGNARKRGLFFETFWWKNFRNYLWNVGKRDTATSNPDSEKPPTSPAEVRLNWKNARKKFKQKLKAVEDLRREAHEILDLLNSQQRITLELDKAEQDILASITHLSSMESRANAGEKDVARLDIELKNLLADQKTCAAERPGMFGAFGRDSPYRKWQAKIRNILSEIEKTRNLITEIRNPLSKKREDVTLARRHNTLAHQRADELRHELKNIVNIFDKKTQTSDFQIPDDDFWSEPEELLQKLCPWRGAAFNAARDELFAAAFELHRAFIDASAKALRHNISVLIKALSSGFTGISEQMRQSLWGSLFLVVPVLSTTLASLGRQFSSLGREQIGWLMIDESGQAAPQSAVGAIWRAKRAVIIGDPLQIEPVTILPERLTANIFSHYGPPHEAWAAPWASAQVLADRGSWLGTELDQDDRSIWVGSPLRVHRRCEEPMFSISNSIAYSGLMVQATPPEKSEIGQVLGDSQWINIESGYSDKWSQAEGDTVIRMLAQLLSINTTPDIFIISPFRQVANNMYRLTRDRLGAHWPWFRDRIGTVHTFQGKEAEAVVLLLGAGNSSSTGARLVMGRKVNVVNVAVTRAKRRLYVVGNRNAWKGIPHFDELAAVLTTSDSNNQMLYKN